MHCYRYYVYEIYELYEKIDQDVYKIVKLHNNLEEQHKIVIHMVKPKVLCHVKFVTHLISIFINTTGILTIATHKNDKNDLVYKFNKSDLINIVKK